MNKLGLYIHVPFCTAKCRYCGFYSVPVAGQEVGRVVSAMIAELDSYKLEKGFARTIYIGGGSPSCIPSEELSRLISEITARAGNPEEFTIEVNPQQTSARELENLRKLGVNRLSIGAQSFAKEELAFLGRPYEPDAIKSAVWDARAAGFENISIDLIFAIPGQTIESWRQTLDQAISLGIEHVSAYALTYEYGTPLAQSLQSGEIKPADEETDRQMYHLAIEMLECAGIRQYEISNFARPGFECRHNLIYWANEEYVGVGPGASSCRKTEKCATRYMNIDDVQEYTKRIAQVQSPVSQKQELTEIEVACETAVLNLRRRKGLVFGEFKEHTGFEAREIFASAIEQNAKAGLLEIDTEGIRLSREALAVADSVLCDFAAQ